MLKRQHEIAPGVIASTMDEFTSRAFRREGLVVYSETAGCLFRKKSHHEEQSHPRENRAPHDGSNGTARFSLCQGEAQKKGANNNKNAAPVKKKHPARRPN